MEDCIIKEKDIITSPEPVTLKGTENIFDQMNNIVCRIYNKGKGTGFFTKIPYKNKFLPVLITINHIIDKNALETNKNITIYLNNDKIMKIIKIDNNRLRYTNKNLDVTIIEIKEREDNLNIKYIELEDEIIKYFKFKKNDDPNYLNNLYNNNSIYLISYREDKHVVVSYGQPPYINNSEIRHKCNTKEGSSGSPILLINNQKLIGIHYGSSKQYNYNYGTLLIYSIKEFEKIKNNLLIINKEGKEENNEINNNYIIAEFDIKENNKNIRVINSYEEVNRETPFLVYNKEYENEKEIKENCEIKIYNKIIPFSYFFKFDKKGKYNIKYIFKKNLTKIHYMFYKCKSLKNINLSNFNFNNVIDMHGMFAWCTSLSNIDLSNFNANNVIYMDIMLSFCKSLTNINLSNFNVNNVTVMRCMFDEIRESNCQCNTLNGNVSFSKKNYNC